MKGDPSDRIPGMKLPLFNYSTKFWSDKTCSSWSVIEYCYEKGEYIYTLTETLKITLSDATEIKTSESAIKRNLELKKITLL